MQEKVNEGKGQKRGKDPPEAEILATAQNLQYSGNLPDATSQSVPLGLNLTY